MEEDTVESENENSSSLEDVLASFRQQWHEEINEINKNDVSTTGASSSRHGKAENENVEEKAARLFLQGTKHERDGNLNAAVYYYRQAIHMVPDIEVKIAEYQVSSSFYSDADDDADDSEVVSIEDNGNDSYQLEGLTSSFALMNVDQPCVQKYSQASTHISALPTELLVLVIKWVISRDLDIGSLENVSLVCRWFYACARDAELWRSICVRVWGINCTSVELYNNNWRWMFVEKPRVRYDGVYLSSNSYVHIGERGFDSFYKPCHLVEYYKYLRFFTDGSVLIYTSADDPQQTIQLLQRPPYRDPTVYKGYYRLTNENVVSIFFTRVTKQQHEGRRRRVQKQTPEVKEYNFYVQLLLKNTKRKKNNQLVWNEYTCQTKNRKTDVTSESDIDISTFRPYYFSGVRSYSLYSSSPL